MSSPTRSIGSAAPQPDTRNSNVLPLNSDQLLLDPPQALAARQIAKAHTLVSRDLSKAPRWSWGSLDALVGPALPGDLTVVGGLQGNGKSSLLMSQMDGLAKKGVPVLYFPLEIDPEICRLHWVAWRNGFDRVKVVRQEWSALPKYAEKGVHDALEDQKADPCIHFASPKRLGFFMLHRWCQWGVQECGAKVIIIDHFHRLVFGDDARNMRTDATEMARKLRDMARTLKVPIIAAAHLNRDGSIDDAYQPPGMHRLKETSALGEEADVVLMVSRKLRPGLPKDWQKAVRAGVMQEWSVGDPGKMVVTCRKHRLDGDQRDRNATLGVSGGHVLDLREPRVDNSHDRD